MTRFAITSILFLAYLPAPATGEPFFPDRQQWETASPSKTGACEEVA